MKGSGGFMHSRYSVLLCALIVIGALLFYGFRESDDDTPVETGGGELQIRGRQLRVEVENTFKAMAKVRAKNTYDLTGMCNKYFPAGTIFSDVEVILIAGGARSAKKGGSVLGPAYNHKLPANSPDRNDLGGGFLLEKSLISNAIFEIIFRPLDVNEAPEKIGEVVSCFVLTTNL